MREVDLLVRSALAAILIVLFVLLLLSISGINAKVALPLEEHWAEEGALLDRYKQKDRWCDVHTESGTQPTAEPSKYETEVKRTKGRSGTRKALLQLAVPLSAADSRSSSVWNGVQGFGSTRSCSEIETRPASEERTGASLLCSSPAFSCHSSDSRTLPKPGKRPRREARGRCPARGARAQREEGRSCRARAAVR